MAELGIACKERMVKFDSEDWQRNIATLSPSRLVPVLWEGEPGEGFATFDTVAILERLHELHPRAGIWPRDAQARSRARSLVADFHAGYGRLRGDMPMNIRGRYPGKGMSDAVAREIDQLCVYWRDARERFGACGDFLFGEFSGADAFFAPVASRFLTYGVSLNDATASSYCDALLNTPSMQAWTAAALEETEFVARDEPYAER